MAAADIPELIKSTGGKHMTTIDKLRRDAAFVENEEWLIRNLTDRDKETYIRTLKGVSKIPQIYETEGFKEFAWMDALTSDSALTLAVERKSDHVYVGECMIRNPDTDCIEIGLDIAVQYQNRGIGTSVLRLLTAEIHRRFPDKKITARIYSDNDQSQRMIKKLGAKKVGEEPAEIAAAMAIMNEISKEMNVEMGKDLILPDGSHIDLFEL